MIHILCKRCYIYLHTLCTFTHKIISYSVLHKNVTTLFLSMIFCVLDWDDYSWLHCDNTVWISVSTDFTMQFLDEHCDENISTATYYKLILKCSVFGLFYLHPSTHFDMQRSQLGDLQIYMSLLNYQNASVFFTFLRYYYNLNVNFSIVL
jgi:hypothetical protein